MARWDNQDFRILKIDDYSQYIVNCARRLSEENEELSFNKALEVINTAEKYIDGDFKDEQVIGIYKDLIDTIISQLRSINDEY